MAHIDTIADRDIQALYRRELLDRFSAFAFPKREPFQPRSASTGWKDRKPSPRGLSPEARATLQRAMAGGQRASLLAAVIAGLVRQPDAIREHAEALSRLARLDPNVAPEIESLMELSETLDSRGPSAISSLQGIPAPPENQTFAFLRQGTSPGDAREELAEAVSLLVQKPALEAAMAATVARFDEDPEGALAEQDRLRTQLMTVDERLKQFGRRKAGTIPVEQD
jgi:DNA primase